MKYKLIHIDTLEVTMCDNITIEGKDYYFSNKYPNDNNGYWVYEIEEGFYSGVNKCNQPIEWFKKLPDKENYKFIIATTNTSLQCPQVVDYAKQLAYIRYGDDINSFGGQRDGYVQGYQTHSETHSLSDEEVKLFAEYSVKNILYDDENGNLIVRTYNELLTQFKSTLPIKIYYR